MHRKQLFIALLLLPLLSAAAGRHSSAPLPAAGTAAGHAAAGERMQTGEITAAARLDGNGGQTETEGGTATGEFANAGEADPTGCRHGDRGGQGAGNGHQAGHGAALAARGSSHRRQPRHRTGACRRPEKPLAERPQLLRPRLRIAHDLVDLRPRARGTDRPAGHGAQHRQRSGAEQGQLRHGAGRRRAHRSAAGPAVDALRAQHDGRRHQRIHALAARVRGCPPERRIRQRRQLPVQGFVLLQDKPRPGHGRDGLLHAYGRILREPRNGREMRLGADGRRTLEGAVAQPCGIADRQYALLLGARTGRVSLCLRRRGNRARRADGHPPGRDTLQRPVLLPPHDPQRRTHGALRRRQFLGGLDHQLPVFRRRDDPRPGFPAPFVFHAQTGAYGTHSHRGHRIPLARTGDVPLAAGRIRILPPRRDERPGAFQADRHRGADTQATPTNTTRNTPTTHGTTTSCCWAAASATPRQAGRSTTNRTTRPDAGASPRACASTTSTPACATAAPRRPATRRPTA